MELAIDPADLPYLPRPLTPAHALTVATMRATGIIPYAYQVRCAEALYRGRDVFCIAGTGCGKTLTFVMLSFLLPKVIVWIVSPLNFIEDQQCKQFRAWGLRAINFNASTSSPRLLEDIKSGKYQVVISSPEAYHDGNKLRPALLSPALQDYRQISVMDEAHCVPMWGLTKFRTAFARCGDLRPLMLKPANCPMIATTATASPSTKKLIESTLKMRDNCHHENLGNFREHMTHEIHRMRGGQKSYHEVCDLLPSSLADVKKTMIFVNDYKAGHAVGAAIRKYYGLSGENARDLVPVYHSLKGDYEKRRIERRFQAGQARILISTEAMTMGVNFPGVETVINYLVPQSQAIWLQRAGRSGREKGSRCRVIIMPTPKMIKDAAEQCEEAGIVVSAELLNLVVKEEVDSDAEDEPAPTAPKATTSKATKGSNKSTSKTARGDITIGMAEYLVTEGCLVEALDREFDNPPHIPCYEIGGCYNCKRKQQADEAAQAPKQEAMELEIRQYDQQAEDLKQQAKESTKDMQRSAEETKIFKKAIQEW